ncbi:YbbR-like domain-containing protein [Salinibacter altiplanensis]|uniref:YbbR-like domain-containing protein n=1 Tax=Salinibacter altiplanensis TaxID=1803181 RepID=UPI000C9FF6E9|nr:YbbR-like domain-containing protein [Salinibacter altiplanensis]
MATNSDSQGAVFWDWLRPLFASTDNEPRREPPPQRGMALTVCVLLSCVLWLSLTLGEQRTQTVRLPVEVTETPEGQALAEVPPTHVQVQVQGRGLDLLRLLYSPPVLKVNATTSQVDVADMVTLPQGTSLQIESVTPASFEMALEPPQTRRIPVQSRVEVDLASDYELIGAPQLVPDSVDIEGAESVVQGVDVWPTAPSTIENLQDTAEVQVPLADTLRRLVDVQPKAVRITARAGRFVEETREVEVEVTGVPSGQDLVSLQPSTVRIRYRVLFRDLFKARRASEFFATVSYDQIRSDTTGYVTPRVHVPPDLYIRDSEPIPSRLRYYTFVSER